MSKYGISYFPFLANENAFLQLLSQPGAQMFLQKSVVYGMTSRPIFCSLGRGRSGPPTLYQLYGCCLEQYQGRQDRGGSWTKFALLAQSVMRGMWTRPILVKNQSYWIGSFRIGPLTYWSTNLSGRLYKNDQICWYLQILHTTYSWNIKWQKCTGMGFNGFVFKK